MHFIVSVVMPLHNAEAFVEQAVASVQAQSFESWELLVVDDASTDTSAERVAKMAQLDSRIKLIRLERNGGAAIARNKAIECAQGRYIAFLDSDDLWRPRKLEKQIQFMKENDYTFTYSAYEKVDDKGVFFQDVGVPEKVAYHDFLKTSVIACSSAIYDVEKIGKVYMPTTTKREDFAAWLRVLKIVDYAHGIPEVLLQYRVYADQSSSNKYKMACETWRVYREVEELGFMRSAYYFSHYAVCGVLRTKFPKLARAVGVLK